MTTSIDALRELLGSLPDWQQAHVGFDAAIEGIPEHLHGTVPPGLPYSPWQLLEHLRITQHDILDSCVNPAYREKAWPDDYWPPPAPATAVAWTESVVAYRRDRDAIRALIHDPAIDPFAAIPHGTGQTYLREVVLVADHAAYHVGQLVLVRRLLGIWPDTR